MFFGLWFIAFEGLGLLVLWLEKHALMAGRDNPHPGFFGLHRSYVVAQRRMENWKLPYIIFDDLGLTIL